MDDIPSCVHAQWDQAAEVWVATSEDVPGLATEATQLEDLIVKLKVMIPELFLENGLPMNDEVTFERLTRRFEVALRTSA